MLANALSQLNKPDSQKYNPALEGELIKCLRTLFNHADGAKDFVEHNSSVGAVTASLASADIPTRKSVVELLVFFIARGGQVGLNLVLKGLADFSNSRRLPSRFDGWFTYWEKAIDGRGRFGSAVGASDSVLSLRSAGATQLSRGLTSGGHQGAGKLSPLNLDVMDSALSDFAVS